MATDRFDKEAAAWDSFPPVVKSSQLAYAAVLEHVPELADDLQAKELDVLEIGCGTGLLSLQVAPRVKSLTAVDPSSGMIKALQAKLAAGAASNVHPICQLFESPNDPAFQGKKFNLVISHMVLHHMPAIDPVVDAMYQLLAPGGYVALTDFERFGPESRKFHPESKMDGVERHGITKIEMECALHEAGFDKVQVTQAFKMDKEIEGGGSMDFPFLICVGMKK